MIGQPGDDSVSQGSLVSSEVALSPTTQRYAEPESRSRLDGRISSVLLSVIVVVFCDREELRLLLESILPHKNEEMEVIVVDGGSDDGTIDLLYALDSQIDHWISEPDNGIYDAMNKGLKAASGEYILHVNAGDRLLAVPWDALRNHSKAKVDVVCCRVLLDGKKEFVSKTNFLSRLDNTWHHQGTFYRRVAHLGYDQTFRMAGDFDHNQRLLKSGCVAREENCIISDHRSGGISTTLRGHQEIYRSVQANFGPFYLALSWMRFLARDIRDWIRARRGIS